MKDDARVRQELERAKQTIERLEASLVQSGESISALARFLGDEFEGSIHDNETACSMAIRVLRAQKKDLEILRECNANQTRLIESRDAVLAGNIPDDFTIGEEVETLGPIAVDPASIPPKRVHKKKSK